MTLLSLSTSLSVAGAVIKVFPGPELMLFCRSRSRDFTIKNENFAGAGIKWDPGRSLVIQLLEKVKKFGIFCWYGSNDEQDWYKIVWETE